MKKTMFLIAVLFIYGATHSVLAQQTPQSIKDMPFSTEYILDKLVKKHHAMIKYEVIHGSTASEISIMGASRTGGGMPEIHSATIKQSEGKVSKIPQWIIDLKNQNSKFQTITVVNITVYDETTDTESKVIGVRPLNFTWLPICRDLNCDLEKLKEFLTEDFQKDYLWFKVK